MISVLPNLPCFFDSECQDITPCKLPDNEANHAIKVLRLVSGSAILVSNGKGSIWQCRVMNVKKNQLQYISETKIIDLSTTPHNVSVACGVISAAARLEWMVEKLVEIGIDTLYLVKTNRSQKKFARMERLEKTALAALKQSRKAFLPKITIIDLAELALLPYSAKYIAICGTEERQHLSDFTKVEKALVLLGPEGDFASEEINLCLNNGFIPCSLGNERLRSETAAIYALICLKLK